MCEVFRLETVGTVRIPRRQQQQNQVEFKFLGADLSADIGDGGRVLT